MDTPRIGLTGLAVMGQNLARNVARHGFPIAVHNRTTEKTRDFVDEFGEGTEYNEPLLFTDSDAAFVEAIAAPRTIVLMVKAGKPVDQVIESLVPHLSPGDLLVDGGNSLWTDTERRIKELAAKDILFLGSGVSGGEEGALNGPSIMPGGSEEGYRRVEDILTAIAAQVDGTPCCTFIGGGGAGHYVKTVHNGIEYADMQLIAEAYDLLKNAAGLSNKEIGDVFAQWNEGDLDSFLIEITARIFRTMDDIAGNDTEPVDEKADTAVSKEAPSGTRTPADEGAKPVSGVYLLDRVLDAAGQKGTGKWVSQSALDLGAPVTAITEAVFARFLSSQKTERMAAAKVLTGPGGGTVEGDKQVFINAVRDALYASKIVAYAQGFDQLKRAATEYGYQLHFGDLATIWRGGCIIRARFLDRIKEAYDADPGLANLMLAPYFTEGLTNAQESWRTVLTEAIKNGVPTPAFSSALAYYDGYRRENLPANLIQAQRDLFGAHTYQRTDREGTFHSRWAD